MIKTGIYRNSEIFDNSNEWPNPVETLVNSTQYSNQEDLDEHATQSECKSYSHLYVSDR